MARNFTIPLLALAVGFPASAAASLDRINQRWVVAYDPDNDESGWWEFIVPDEFTGSGTLKAKIKYFANTATAADDVRFDLSTEFRTPNSPDQDMDVDDFDVSLDSGTGTFTLSPYSLREVTITLTPATAPAAGDAGRIRVTRDADHATLDSLAVDCFIWAIEVYEEV